MPKKQFMEKYLPKSRTCDTFKYMAVAAHKDDVELMASDGILKGLDYGFAAVVLTDGGACPRAAEYAAVSDEDMADLRTAEQKRAAEIGRYSALFLLEKTSNQVKDCEMDIVLQIFDILNSVPQLEALYLHNSFDRHNTHVAAFKCAIQAVRMLEKDKKPKKIYGCEVWRSLDFLSDEYRLVFDIGGMLQPYETLQKEEKYSPGENSDGHNFAERLFSCFATQNAAKNYGEAFISRAKANATFGASHEQNATSAASYAVDLTVLKDESVDICSFCEEILDKFKLDVLKNLH